MASGHGRGHHHGGDRLLPRKRLGIQLFTVRDQVAALGFEAVIARLSAIGYAGVEFAGYSAGPPPARRYTNAEIRALLRKYHLKAFGSHVNYVAVAHESVQLRDAARAVLDDAEEIGIPLHRDGEPARGALRRDRRRLPARRGGLQPLRRRGPGSRAALLHHHHSEEFALPGGTRLYDVLLEETDPSSCSSSSRSSGRTSASRASRASSRTSTRGTCPSASRCSTSRTGSTTCQSWLPRTREHGDPDPPASVGDDLALARVAPPRLNPIGSHVGYYGHDPNPVHLRAEPRQGPRRRRGPRPQAHRHRLRPLPLRLHRRRLEAAAEEFNPRGAAAREGARPEVLPAQPLGGVLLRHRQPEGPAVRRPARRDRPRRSSTWRWTSSGRTRPVRFSPRPLRAARLPSAARPLPALPREGREEVGAGGGAGERRRPTRPAVGVAGRNAGRPPPRRAAERRFLRSS